MEFDLAVRFFRRKWYRSQRKVLKKSLTDNNTEGAIWNGICEETEEMKYFWWNTRTYFGIKAISRWINNFRKLFSEISFFFAPYWIFQMMHYLPYYKPGWYDECIRFNFNHCQKFYSRIFRFEYETWLVYSRSYEKILFQAFQDL